MLVAKCFATNDSIAANKGFWKHTLNHLYGFIKDFSRIDEDYVEPQHYNYQVMLQNTNTYEVYTLRTQEDYKVVLAPEPTYKIGPYFGWRWIFLGYTIDLTHLNGGNNRKELDLSLYSSQVGIDLFYRKAGNDYKIRSLNMGDNVNTDNMKDVDFNGFNTSIKGFNLYYIFNHKKFSYPAAFSQSTVQRRSCGSALLGIGYTKHNLSIDWDEFNSLVKERLGNEIDNVQIDSTLQSGKINYTDMSVSGGYAYNWVFAHNWLLAVSASMALGYKHSTGEAQEKTLSFKDFSFSNFNIDGVGRFGIVWNNTKWYFGMSSILHAYNYKKSRFSTNSVFGNLNFYIGFNFNRR